MSWSQEYYMPSVFSLLKEIVRNDLNDDDIIRYALKGMGLGHDVSTIRDVTLREDMYGEYNVNGQEITINGITYVQKLYKVETFNGDNGVHSYKWVPNDEEVEILFYNDGARYIGEEGG